MRMEITNTFPDYLSELENKIVFFDNDLLVFDNLKDFNVKGKIEVEVYVLTLCTKGHGTLAVNEKKCELKSNDIFICRPSHILETLMMSVDFECLCICMTREFLQDILMRSNSSWNMKVYIEDNPVLHIDEEDAELIIQYAQLIKATMAQSNKHYYKEIVTSLLCAMSFDFSNILEKKISAEKPMFSTSENLFNDFFDTDFMPRTNATAPAINVKESAVDYEVEVAAPGMTKEDFNVHLNQEGDLHIKMESKKEHNEDNKKAHYLRREFAYSKFEQTLILPDDVDRNNISAKVADGVLTVTLPKLKKEEQNVVRQITVG